MKARLAPILAALCLAAAGAAAQTAPQADPGVTREDCRAAPESGGDQPGGDSTSKLDDCNGVLQPPPTGDAGIAEPAPDAGTTPVVPPGALPEQPPAEQSPDTPPASGDTPT